MSENYDWFVADYNLDEQKKPIVYLFARNQQRERVIFVITSFKPHFFGAVHPEVLPPVALPIVNSVEPIRLDIFGRPVVEVFTEKPGDVKEARKAYEFTDEADILFYLRYLLDKKIISGFSALGGERTYYTVGKSTVLRIKDADLIPTISTDIPPLKLYGDIEVESPPGILPSPENPIWPIVSAQFSNNYNKELDLFMLDVLLPSGVWLSQICPQDFQIGVEHKRGKELLIPNIRWFTNEKEMLYAIANYVQDKDPDLLSGWNFTRFDIPYFERRAIKLGVYIKQISPFGLVKYEKRFDPELRKITAQVWVKGRIILDMLAAYQKWSTGRQPIKKGEPFGLTYDFKIVVQKETGFSYVDYGDRIQDIRQKDILEWVGYCTKDAFALRLLDEVTDVIKHFDRLRRIVGAPIDWALHNSRIIDTWLLRIRENPLPTKKHGIKQRSRGAMVFLPPVGVHQNVVNMDIKTLYPILIMVYNLSPETKDPKGEITVGPMEDGLLLHFKRKPEGIIPRAIRIVYNEREKYRAILKKMSSTDPAYMYTKQLETLYKFLACSFFGVMGYENFRLADEDVKRSILFLGRTTIRECKAACERAGYQVVYGDTDSLFIKLRSGQPREGAIIESIINETLTKFAFSRGGRVSPEAKYEHFCKRILFKPKIVKRRGEIVAAKKRYAYTDEKNQLYVVGLEPRRSGTAEITRNTMIDFLERVLVKDDVQSALTLLRDTYNSLPTLPLNRVAIPKGLHKSSYIRQKKISRGAKGDFGDSTKESDWKVVEIKSKNPWKLGVEFSQKILGLNFREDRKPLLLYINPKLIGTEHRIDFESFAFEEVDKFGRMLKEKTYALCITEEMTELPKWLQQAIDWEKMRERTITKQFSSLLAAIGLDWDAVTTGTKQSTLGGFSNVTPQITS